MVGQTLEGKAMLISGINRSGDDISSDISVDGQANTTTPAVQFFFTDNIHTCKAAGKSIETTYPHIFWSGCTVHTLSLLLKDIVYSIHPSLVFVAK